MKRLGIGFGIGGLVLLAAACSDDPATTNTGTAGSSGTATSAGTTSGGMTTGGSSAGTGVTAGTTTGGGSTAGTGTGGQAGGSAGAGGGAAGSSGSGGGGGSAGGGTCDTKPGKAIKFVQGKLDSVAGDLGADGTLGDKPRTIELWAKFLGTHSWDDERSVLELGKPSSPDDGNNVFGIDMSGRKGQGGVFGPYTHGVSDNNGTGAPPFLDNTAADVGWLHLSWSYDPTKAANMRLEFTVNGNVLPVQFNQTAWDKTQGKLVGNTGYVLLGDSQQFGDAGGWDGVMDEVRLWGVARTAQQVKDNMNVVMKPTTPGLIAYYQFNEADASNVKDSTGNAAHKLAACTAATGACSKMNVQPPTFVDSDIPGTFTCGQ